jgi:pyruvate/2-oxoglutarate dehydrogenase complex dihydrolipoamide acyltransferase (E2) component
MISEILMSCLSEAGEKGTVVEQLAETGGRLSKGKILAHLEGMLAQPQAWAR